jgi:hypothetical protein
METQEHTYKQTKEAKFCFFGANEARALDHVIF